MVKFKFRLIPKDETFYDLFEESAENVLHTAELFEDLVLNYTDIPAKARLIYDCEHKGDGITHALVDKLSSTFVTPIDREDIHALALTLDDVADFIHASAQKLMLYKIEKPTATLAKLTRVLVDSAKLLPKMVCGLRSSENIKPLVIEVHRLENLGDEISRAALAELFNGSYEPMDVIKWKDIYEYLENAIDKCEDVSDVVRGVVLKNA